MRAKNLNDCSSPITSTTFFFFTALALLLYFIFCKGWKNVCTTILPRVYLTHPIKHKRRACGPRAPHCGFLFATPRALRFFL